MINIIKAGKSWDNEYRVIYSVDSGKDLIDALRQCKNSIDSIEIKEDADVGFASYGGSYTFDQLDKEFDLNHLYFDKMYIHFKNDDTRFAYYGYENELNVITQDPNFDLDTFLSEKNT
jgi:hypothetical protein